MNIFGIGLPEMVLILVVALLVFGPKKLPEIGRSLGKALRSFQDASKEFETEFKREADRLEQATTMEATLERPSQSVLSPASSEANPSTREPSTVEPVTVEPATVELSPIEPSTVEPGSTELPNQDPIATPEDASTQVSVDEEPAVS